MTTNQRRIGLDNNAMFTTVSDYGTLLTVGVKLG